MCPDYEATNDFPCEPTGVCETCTPSPTGEKNCTKIEDYDAWTLSEYAYVLSGDRDTDVRGVKVSSEQRIKAELYAHGPLACGIHATDELEAFGTTTPVASYPGGIYQQRVLLPIPNHILSIVGWGRDPTYGDYWWLRNSWGTYWGEDGFAKIKMGGQNLGIEGSCSWATPTKMKTATTTEKTEMTTEKMETSEMTVGGAFYKLDSTIQRGTFFDYERAPRPVDRSGSVASTRIISPLPRFEDAPAEWDVRAVGPKKINFASPDRNQHIPQCVALDGGWMPLRLIDSPLELPPIPL